MKGLAPAYLSDLCVDNAAVQVVLVRDLQFEVILLCQDTGQSGVQGLLLWLVCSGSIVLTTLDCGPGDFWFEFRVGANIL